MANATDALNELAAALDRLEKRVPDSNPRRKKRVVALALVCGDMVPATAAEAVIERLRASRVAIDGLLVTGSFPSVMNEAEDAVRSV